MRKHLHLLSSLGYRSRRRFLKHESASGLALCTLAISWKMFFNRSYYLRDVTAANRQKKKKKFCLSLPCGDFKPHILAIFSHLWKKDICHSFVALRTLCKFLSHFRLEHNDAIFIFLHRQPGNVPFFLFIVDEFCWRFHGSFLHGQFLGLLNDANGVGRAQEEPKIK